MSSCHGPSHHKSRLHVCRNKKLEVLFLQDNDIETITPTLKHLRQLKKLRLDKNNIATLQHFDNLGNLVELNVSRNAIKIAKVGLADRPCLALPRLATPWCYPLHNLPCCGEQQGFRHLRSLRTLRITDNSLKAIGDIPACVTLQELDFSRNRLESFKGLGSLTRLQVSSEDRRPCVSLCYEPPCWCNGPWPGMLVLHCLLLFLICRRCCCCGINRPFAWLAMA